MVLPIIGYGAIVLKTKAKEIQENPVKVSRQNILKIINTNTYHTTDFLKIPKK